MAAVAVAAIGSVVSSAVAGSAFVAGLGLTGIFAQAFGAVAGFATSSLLGGMLGNDSGGQQDTGFGGSGSFQSEAQGRLQVVRSAAASRKFVYGEVMLSGPLVYAEVGGAGNRYLHMVIVLAPHEINSIGDVYFNDIAITSAQLDGSGNVTSGPYSGTARIKKHLGTVGEVADADLVAESAGKWTAAHTLDGCAYIYIRLDYSQSIYPGGIPNFKAVVQGKKLYDPRTGTTVYSSNWALVARDYLTTSAQEGGLGAISSDIDDTQVITAANACEERVAMTGTHTNTYTVSTSTELVTLTNTETTIASGDGVRISTTGVFPISADDSITPGYLSLPGVNGNYISTPNTAAVDPSGSIDLRVRVSLTNLAPANYGPLLSNLNAGNSRGFYLAIAQSSSGLLEFGWRPSSGTSYFAWSTVTLAAAGITTGTKLWLRATLNVTSGVVTFYSSTEATPTTWTQIGAAVSTGASGTNIGASGAPLTAGRFGGFAGFEYLVASIYRAQLYNGIGGSLVADMDPRLAADGASSFVASTGETWTVATSGGTPARLTAVAGSTTYYWHRKSPTTGYLCSTAANARAGTPIDITNAGSGTHTLTHWNHERYTANGTIDTARRPLDILKDLVSAAAGTITIPQGVFRLMPGVYDTPTVTLTASDLRGPVSLTTRVPRRELFNAVRGTYSNPDNYWQPSDFPQVTNDTYADDDGGDVITKDIELPFTTDAIRAQRIGKIHLEKSRQGITVTMPCNMQQAFGLAMWDTVMVTLSQLGWSAKVFRVVRWQLAPDGLGVDLTLREDTSASYDWAAGEATIVDPAPDTNLPSIAVSALSGLALSSGTADLFITGDGTVQSRIKASWTAVANVFVTSGGHIEVQFKKSADSLWQDAPDVAGDAAQTYIGPVDDGVSYDVRARAVSTIGVAGSWATVIAHTVAGKTAAPTTPSGFTAQQSGPGTVLFACASIADADLKRIEVRLLDYDDETWANGIPICNILKGFTSTTGAVQPGTWTFLAAAFDTSENQSAANARIDLTVTADGFSSVINRQDYPDWLGTLTNMVKRYDGTLTAESQSLASALGWEVFDQFVPNPYTTCTYEAPALDKSIDGSLRVYADIVSALGPGVTTGISNPQHSIDYKLAAGSYDGFENWTVGYADFRYLKSKLTLDTSVGNAAIRGFRTVADGQARTESESAITVGAAGTAFTFDAPFHSAPIVSLRNEGATPLLPTVTSISGTGATLHLYNTSGTETGGTGGYTATGV